MKEKLALYTVMFLGLALILAHAQAPGRSESTPNRYQIVIAPTSSGDSPQVFKLDTITGKTWEVAFAMQGTAKTVVWGLISDLPESKK